MRKCRLTIIRKQGEQYRRFQVRFHRDSVTGERSFCLSGFGRMRMYCLEEPIPELHSLVQDFRLS
jgi:hypothetical protein